MFKESEICLSIDALLVEVCYLTSARGSQNTFGFRVGFGLMFNG